MGSLFLFVLIFMGISLLDKAFSVLFPLFFYFNTSIIYSALLNGIVYGELVESLNTFSRRNNIICKPEDLVSNLYSFTDI